jgi:hypothetical protein
MTNPLPVTIIRPKRDLQEVLIQCAVGLGALAIRAWLVMLFVPAIVPSWHPTFWKSLAAIILFGALRGETDQYRLWTREAKP